jgi:hypothetical protein
MFKQTPKHHHRMYNKTFLLKFRHVFLIIEHLSGWHISLHVELLILMNIVRNIHFWPLAPKVAGSNPAEAVGFLRT